MDTSTVGNNKYSLLLVSLNEKEYQQVLLKQEKVERMFNVTLTFDACKGPRWMAIKGGYRDCSNARSYIKSSLESPENGTSVIYLPPSVTDEYIESIETKSLAAITKNAYDGSYKISGAKITVSMAMTLLEEYAQAEKCMNEMTMTPLKTKSNKASRRLSCALQETLTKVNRRGNYLHASDAVKRAIVGCLLDENENADQVDSKAGSDAKTTETPSNKTEDPEVILIEDDSDDELMPIVEVDEDDDDDIMIIETPRKPPNADGNNHFFGKNFDKTKAACTNTDDSVIIIGTPTVIDNKQSGKKADALATVTKAFSEMQTPSKLEPNSPNLKVTKAVQQPIGGNKQHGSKPTEEIKRSNEATDVLETKSSSKKKKKRNKMKRKLSLSDDEMNDDRVFPDGGKIPRKDKSFDSEEEKRKRKILKRGKVKDKKDRVNDEKINFVPSKSHDKNTDKGKENTDLSVREIKPKSKAQDQISERVRKSTRFSDKAPTDENVNAVRRTVILPTKVTSKDKTSFTEIRTLKITSKDETVHTERRTVKLPTKATSKDENTESRTVKIIPRATSLNEPVNNASLEQKASNDHPSKSTCIGGSSGIDESDSRRPVDSQPTLRPIQDYRTPRRNDLRYIVIDGSNVAMAHGKNKVFSCIGLRICVEFFLRRGHRLITVFLPHWRKCRPQFENSMTHRGELDALEKDGYLVYTPSRKIGRQLVAAYDDRFIIELADREDGVVVSNDQYRDLCDEKYSWRHIIQNRLLMFTFVHDHFMVPNDPCGRYGPHLDQFLKHTDLRQKLKSIEARHMAPAVENGHNDFMLCSR